MKLGRFHLSVRKHILTHLGIEQMAKNAADSLKWKFLRLRPASAFGYFGGWMYLEVGAFLSPWDTLNFGFIVGILPLSGCLLVWGMCSQCLPDLCL